MKPERFSSREEVVKKAVILKITGWLLNEGLITFCTPNAVYKLGVIEGQTRMCRGEMFLLLECSKE